MNKKSICWFTKKNKETILSFNFECKNIVDNKKIWKTTKKKISDWSSSFEKNIIKQDRVITDDSSMITLVALSDLELKIIGALIFHSPKNTR